MPSKVFAHVGLPKTGTTYIQQLMYANADAFAAQGVTVVGNHKLHFDAGSEIAGVRAPRRRVVPEGEWDQVVRLVGKVRTDTALFSNERYSLTRGEGVARMAGSFPDSELHVVVTLRDLVEAAPSAWQEHVKNGGTQTWPEFCDDWASDPEDVDRTRVRRVFENWPRHLPPERIHVVTAPRPGAPQELIFERFCSVVGVDLAGMETLQPERSNTSLDPVVTEMLRGLNARRPSLPVDVHKDEVKKWLAGGILERRDVPRPTLTGAALADAEGETGWLVRTMREGGFHLVGDLAELVTEKAPPSVVPAPTDADLLDAALEALAAMTQRSHQRGRKIRRLRKASKAEVVPAAVSPLLDKLRRRARRSRRG